MKTEYGKKQMECRVYKTGIRQFIIGLSFYVSFSLLFAMLFFSPAYSYEGRVVMTLQECISRAIEVSPEIGESRYEEDVYKSKKMQADSSAYPQIEVLAIAGPSPEAKREYVSPVINTSVGTTINGIFGNVEATLIQPIYTFGKISSYKIAASSGIEAARAGTAKKTSDIILRTKELYYGLLLAKDIKNLLLEIKDDLVDSIKKAERHIEMDSPWADEVNLFKLRAFLGEVDKRLNETEKGIAIAKDALATSIGLPQGVDFDIFDDSIKPEERLPEEISKYINLSFELRPEFTQLREGLNARRYLIEAEMSNYYPQLFVGVKLSAAGATNREKINNPYIMDYFNHSYGAIFLGLKWSIDFGITEGRVREARAEYHKLTEKKRFAESAIPFQVRKAYLDYEESMKNVIETEKAYTNARKWLVASVANFDLGLVDAKEVADAALAYAQMKADNLRYKYNSRISFANLLYATGLDIQEIK